ncbi:unnamed protein product [Gongylonema pulchrum]|uniref:Glycylpeptide N-tetradecanoyltransferase n=1 Tax=Gongylonema pulchrum TaxID=637853 RepID=A0A3P6RVP2_9BILA|nr:unnamed protein product [Gongylonema pulchrum]
MISFYSLPSSVMHHPLYKSIQAAYSFYNVATSIPLKQLMNDALIIARNCFIEAPKSIHITAIIVEIYQ